MRPQRRESPTCARVHTTMHVSANFAVIHITVFCRERQPPPPSRARRPDGRILHGGNTPRRGGRRRAHRAARGNRPMAQGAPPRPAPPFNGNRRPASTAGGARAKLRYTGQRRAAPWRARSPAVRKGALHAHAPRIRQRQVHRPASRAHPQPHQPVRRKLYLEFGGKLFDDYHAARVLPGFEPDSKIRMLKQLADDVEIVVVINANDIEKSKLRGDLGITYDDDVLRLMDIFQGMGFLVGSVVVTTTPASPTPTRSAAGSPRWASGTTCTTPLPATPTTSTTSSATRASAETTTWKPAARWWW